MLRLMLPAFLCASFIFPALAASTLTDDDLQKLHRTAAICDADTASDGAVCNPVYEKLISYYGSYEAYIAASKKYKM